MNILVCIKQVPASQNVKIDPNTCSLMRWASSTKMNPFDLIALEAALQLKDKLEANITVITMGPSQAKAVLIEALAMGVDEAVLISDRAFAGADVLATSHTLAYAIQSLPKTFDLILCGQQTTDGDTAQVGPSIAALLHLPHISFVRDLVVRDNEFEVSTIINDDHIISSITKPCLLTIDKDFAQARYPSYWRLKEIEKTSLKIITLEDMNDPDAINHVGQIGSPTSVQRIFPPVHDGVTQQLSGRPAVIVDALMDYLKSEHLIHGGSHE